MKKILITLSFLSITILSYAQMPGGMPAGGGKMPSISGRVFGKIVDATTKQPIEFASVIALRPMGKRDSMLGGGLTLQNGEFNIDNVPLGGIKVKVSFLGFKDFVKQNVMIMPPDNLEVDLGDIELQSDAKVLSTVDVTAQKSSMQLSLDKKVFNVDKNITATSGTAEDVLKNVPSVTVDADGTAKLRNNATTIYVDGRPTMLSMSQIAADQIESVEVMTNPSAKFEASTTGGIINIVTKKNKKPGYNGFVGLSIGTGNRYSGTLNLNVKEGRTNVTGFYTINSMRNPTNGYSYRTNFDSTGGVKNYYNQKTKTSFDNLFQVGRVSVDYQITNRNMLTVAGTYVNGQFDIKSDVEDVFLTPTKLAFNKGTRSVRPINEFKNYGIQAIWKKTFPKKGKELTTDLNFNFGNSVNTADWLTTSNNLNPDGSIASTGILKNVIDGGNNGNQVTFQMDYTNPINDSTKIEMGVRSFTNVRTQDYYFYTNINDKLELDRSISQNTDISDVINAAYMTFSSRLKGISYQAGVRFEQSKFDGTSKLDNTKFGYNYPGSGSNLLKSFFPSLYLSKKLDKTSEIQVNFSRKIERPNFMQLMPIIQNTDRQNIRIGNPKLQPEFVNLSELNYNKLFGAHNWLISLYYMLETNTIKPFTSASTTDPSVLITTFINAKNETRYGLDNTLKLTISKNVDFSTNFNLFNFGISSDVVSKHSWAYNGKGNINWKLPNKLKSFSVQLNGNYESKRLALQGERGANAFMDFAVKYTFMRIASLTFAVNDVFDSRKEISYLTQPSFYQESMRRRDLRNFKLSFQMPFGKMDASIFRKAKDAKKQQTPGQDMDFGGS